MGGDEQRIKVLIAERTAHFRETLRRAATEYRGWECVGEAGTLSEAVEIASRASPDIVLLDFGLAASENAVSLRSLGQRSPRTQVVILLDDDSEDYRRAVQERWGCFCVAKDSITEYFMGCPHSSTGSVMG